MNITLPRSFRLFADLNYPLIILFGASVTLFIAFPIVFWVALGIVGTFALFCLVQYDFIPLYRALMAEFHRRGDIIKMERRRPPRAYVFDTRPKMPINWWHLGEVSLFVLAGIGINLLFWGGLAMLVGLWP